MPEGQQDHAGVAVSLAIVASRLHQPLDPAMARSICLGSCLKELSSLAMYRKDWAQPPEYFEARAKYLQLADKASRTVVLLTEGLDRHRGGGQQQIVVKHVTVNANQAMVAESITTATSLQDNSQGVLDQAIQPALVEGGGGNRNERQPHAPM